MNAVTRVFAYCALPALIAALMAGCATRYVAGNIDKPGSSDGIGDVVAFETAADFNTKPPLCLGVLPLTAKAEFGPSDDLRKALHAHLAPSGIALIPLQKIDALADKSMDELQRLRTVAKGSGCDTLLSGEVTERSSRFWGVYSEIRLGANLRMTREQSFAGLADVVRRMEKDARAAKADRPARSHRSALAAARLELDLL